MSPDAADIVGRALDARLAAGGSRPFVLGICGAQGSGKSTLADVLVARLAARGLRAATLSLDDLYLSRAAREERACTVHPLFRRRGVPGTHDVARGLATFAALDAGRPVRLPRFDKACDDPYPEAEWPLVDHALDVLVFEGWCVGATPQPAAALAEPVNALERDRDPDGVWRYAVNAALGGDYQALFGRIDLLVLLAAPDFAIVRTWRIEQEHALRDRLRRAGRSIEGAMGDDEIAEFIQYFERLTRHIVATMPAYADVTIALDADRRNVG